MKKLVFSLILFASLATTALAQNAIVFVLKPEETKAIKASYDALRAAQAAYDTLKNEVIAKHNDKDTLVLSSAWSFSSDFKAVIPILDSPTVYGGTYPCLAWTSAPAGGLTNLSNTITNSGNGNTISIK